MKVIAKPDRIAGVTLVELLVTIVILSIMVAAVISGIGMLVSRSADPLVTQKSLLLAQAYADEILTKRFADATPLGGIPPVTGAAACLVGPESGEVRSGFDDVDDYDGVDDAPPLLQTGVGVSGYDDYRVTVAVACAGTALGLAADGYAKAVTINIFDPTGRSLTFLSYRGNY